MSNPTDKILGILRERGDVKPRGKGWRCCCPAHDDTHPSLDIDTGHDNRVLLCCRSAGCSAAQITGALGLSMRDLFNGTMPDVEKMSFEDRIQAVYDYRDEQGMLLYQTVRLWAPAPKNKDFRQRRPDGNGGWIWKLGDTRRVLYRLPELLAAGESKWVFVVEGEKDADALARLGLAATTNPMGAGKWRVEYAEVLRGRRVVVISDNDEPGRKHAGEIEHSLQGIALELVRLDLPALPEKGDVSDWLSAGGTVAKLLELVEATARSSPSPAAEVTPPVTLPDPHPWPPPLAEEGYHGLTGRFVRAIEPATEADNVALLIQFLVGVGAAIGRTAHAVVEGDQHFTNEFAVLVGKSAKGRKGTSLGRVKMTLARADSEWSQNRIVSGLSSGEGLIWQVRDPIEKNEPVRRRGEPTTYETVVADDGVADKRLLVVEAEFANVLKQTDRTGNTLSPIIRQAWDCGSIRSLTKNSPARATGAHVSVIGHITAEELRRYLTATETANGFGNRFLWFCVQRSKLLPDGGTPDFAELASIERDLVDVMEFARSIGEIRRDDSAAEVWRSVYGTLSRDRYGLAGSLLGRAEAHVLRLSVLYAVLDRSPFVKSDHLLAALAVWQFCEDSVTHLFGTSTGNPTADEIMILLRATPHGATRSAIRDLMGTKVPAERITSALALLAEMGLARRETQETGGRPAETWFANMGGPRV